MNKTKKLALLVLLTTSINLFSQNKADALRDAKIASEAAFNMNFETVLKHALPAVIEEMGGKDAALKVMKSSFEGMKSQGFEFEKTEIKQVSEVVKEQGQYRCIVENFNQMKMSGKRVLSTTYLLGIYNDTDDYWWFMEANKLKNKTQSDIILPNFETQLKIPENDGKVEVVD
ncbi:hypothetical protein [Winogradskyella vidalii]|uniref:hypothetical protein n=1 Tax=Winogradskyella vidalii TaxID=2615024 RepID=UPI0015CA1193|nr:hypothetical protein [Winogradskyella vidalii]